MIFCKGRQEKNEMLKAGRKLYNLRLVAATSGNLSMKTGSGRILITATASALGDLKHSDLIEVDLSGPGDEKGKPVTTEFPLHSLIHKNFPQKAVIHCHPPLINAYFAVYSDIKALTFETKLYLGQVPVVAQDTPSVTQPELVIQALKSSNLVVLKNHGLVAIADNFQGALNLIETLEEAVRTNAVARLFKKEILDDLDKELKAAVSSSASYQMFSRAHIQAIVDLVNQDEFILKKGGELDLTVQLAIKMDGQEEAFKFNFEKGRIIRLDSDADAPFVISAPPQVWEAVFLGQLEPFVATTQGKMKLKGDLGKLSRWYVPFSRLFELFKQVKIK